MKRKINFHYDEGRQERVNNLKNRNFYVFALLIYLKFQSQNFIVAAASCVACLTWKMYHFNHFWKVLWGNSKWTLIAIHSYKLIAKSDLIILNFCSFLEYVIYDKICKRHSSLMPPSSARFFKLNMLNVKFSFLAALSKKEVTEFYDSRKHSSTFLLFVIKRVIIQKQ